MHVHTPQHIQSQGVSHTTLQALCTLARCLGDDSLENLNKVMHAQRRILLFHCLVCRSQDSWCAALTIPGVSQQAEYLQRAKQSDPERSERLQAELDNVEKKKRKAAAAQVSPNPRKGPQRHLLSVLSIFRA